MAALRLDSLRRPFFRSGFGGRDSLCAGRHGISLNQTDQRGNNRDGEQAGDGEQALMPFALKAALLGDTIEPGSKAQHHGGRQ